MSAPYKGLMGTLTPLPPDRATDYIPVDVELKIQHGKWLWGPKASYELFL